MPDDPLAGRFTWILVTGALGAFGFGWGTGSNDVANAFGTSVGARTLTLKQAVILAVIFEFTGAIVLGRVSAETIAGGIAKADTFKSNAPAYAYGMSIVLWLGFLWQAFASSMGWNVSATHSIIGGIIGFAMTWGGVDSVFWAESDPTKVPPIKGVVPIVISWFFSPIFTGCASAFFYGLTRYFVLLSPNSTERSYYVLPIMVLFTVLIDVYFTFTKGAKKSFSSSDDWSDEKALWISFVVAAFCSFLSGVFGIPYLRSRLRRKQAQDAVKSKMQNDSKSAGDVVNVSIVESDSLPTDLSPIAKQLPESQSVAVSGSAFGDNANMDKSGMSAASDLDRSRLSTASSLSALKKRMMAGVEYDIHQHVEEDPVVAAIHANAEKWDPDTEFIFGFLQVVSAICVIFAHGAGEVGYMAGPLAVIYNVVSSPANNVVAKSGKVNPEIWIILIGAFGLVVGLATYGYKVCAAVGTQLAKITPSRGYAAELATSFVIMIAAQYGLPTSSSQCITGGIMGIAVFEGAKGINYKLLGFTAMSWVWTMIVMSLGTSLIFSQGVYAPSRFVEYSYHDKFAESYTTTCNEFNYCARGEFLNGCGLTSVSPRKFSMGTCKNCTKQASDNCKAYQYLSKCGGLSGGTCTNCSSKSATTTANPFTSCPTGNWLSGCPGKCLNMSMFP